MAMTGNYLLRKPGYFLFFLVRSRLQLTTRWCLAMLLVALTLVCGSVVRAEPLVIATSKTGWLVLIADKKGFFKKHQVDVKIELASSGVAAGAGLVDGKYDLATMSEFAFVSRSFNHSSLRVIATVAAIDNVRLVGRHDKAITAASDLPGKKIGLLEQAIGEFFLGKLLDINGIAADQVTTVNLRPPKLPEALAAGAVDAIVSWEPWASLAGDKLGANQVNMTVQGGQAYYFVLAAKEEDLVEKTTAIQKVIAALYEASNWAVKNEAEAKLTLAERLQTDLVAITKFWPNHSMDVSLSQDLLFLMDEEAAWRKSRGLSKGEAPDFLHLMNTDFLMKVDPSRVSIIR